MEYNFGIFVVLLFLLKDCGNLVTTLKAQPRTLVFPPTAPTRIQFIGGIGIPVEDLNFESITSGYVFKAEYFLPETAESLHPQQLSPLNIQGRTFNAATATTTATTAAATTEVQSSTRSLLRNITQSRQQRDASNVNEHSERLRTGANSQRQQSSAAVYRWIIYSGIETLLSRNSLPGRTCMLRSICEHAATPLHYTSGMLAEILHIILTPSTSHDSSVFATDAAYLKAEILGRGGGDCTLAFADCLHSPLDRISAVFDIEA